MPDAPAVVQARPGCGAVLTGSDRCTENKDEQNWLRALNEPGGCTSISEFREKNSVSCDALRDGKLLHGIFSNIMRGA